MKRAVVVSIGVLAAALVFSATRWIGRGSKHDSDARSAAEARDVDTTSHATAVSGEGARGEPADRSPSLATASRATAESDERPKAPIVLRGRVLDRLSRAPLADARVRAYRGALLLRGTAGAYHPPFGSTVGEEPDEAGVDTPLAETMSDGDGRFEFRADALAERWVALTIDSEWHYLATPASAACGTDVECALEADRGGRLAGGAFTSDGSPVEGATVIVTTTFGIAQAFDRLRPPAVERETATSSDGSFAIGGLPPADSYTVSAWGNGLTPVERASGPIELDRTTRIHLRGQAGGTVDGIVVDSSGVPVSGARVRAGRAEIENEFIPEPPPPVYDAMSGPDGRFRIENVLPGRVRVTAWTTTHCPRTTDDGMAKFNETKSRDVEVRVGSVSRPVRIELHPGAVVSGEVRGPDGSPVGDAEIVLSGWMTYESERPESGGGMTWQLRRTRSDPAGRFRIEGVPGPGPFRVTARKKPFAPVSIADVRSRATEIRLDLSAGGGVTGRVVDGDRGEPVSSFSISLVPLPDARELEELSARFPKTDRSGEAESSDARRATSSVLSYLWSRGSGASSDFAEAFDTPDGGFLLEEVSAGRYALVAEADGYLPRELPALDISSGNVTRGVIVSLESASTIRGRVVRPDGTTPGRALVAASTSDRGREGPMCLHDLFRPEGGHEAWTENDGTFELRNLAAGTYDLVARAEGCARGSTSGIRIGAGQALEGVEVRLRAGGTITGTVTDLDGRPLPGRIVGAFSMDAEHASQSRTAGDGRYSLSGVEPGAYVVFFANGPDTTGGSFAEGGQTSMAVVRDGESTTVNFEDAGESGCRVRGTVLSNGRSVSRGTLVATQGDIERSGIGPTSLESTETDDDGRYEYQSLAPGTYTFRFQARDDRARHEEAGIQALIPEEDEFHLDLDFATTFIAGVLVDSASGEGVSDGSVRLVPSRSVEEWNSRGWVGRAAEADGSFRLDSVAPGDYALVAHAQSFVPGRGTVGYAPTRIDDIRVETGRPITGLIVRLHRGGTLRLTLSGASNAQVRKAWLALTDDASPQSAPRCWTVSEGVFELRDELPPGAYSGVVLAPGFASAVVTGIDIAPSTVTERSLQLVKGTAVNVTLVRANGQRSADARIEVLDASGRRLTPPEDVAAMQGTYGFLREGVEGDFDPDFVGRFAPGSYRVRASREGVEVASGVVELSGEERKTVTLREK